MKYSGSIFSFKSSVGSIYNAVMDDARCYLWKGKAVAEINGKKLTTIFNWNGETFDSKLGLLKENYYTEKIFIDREDWGNIYTAIC